MDAVAALRAGQPVVLPTDTVYGLCADASSEEACLRALALKGRPEEQPAALVCADVEALLERVPELPEEIVRALLPGPYTLVFPNPEGRFVWLAEETIGVRVPQLPDDAAEVVRASRRGDGDEREHARQARPAVARRSARGDSRGLRRARGRWRASGRVVDGARPHGQGAASASRGRRPRRRGPLAPLCFVNGARHELRVCASSVSIHAGATSTIRPMVATALSLEKLRTAGLADIDPDIAALLDRELERQRAEIELIASENFTWPSVLEAVGSTPTNKYSEGYPGRRYYGGCEVVDEIEQLAIDRAKALFGAEHANVQPHAGAQTNMAVYFSCLDPGDTILSLELSHGGHLTHGLKVNFSGRLYTIVHYGVSRETSLVDYDEVRQLAKAAPAEAHRLRRLRVPAGGRGRALPRDRRRGRRVPPLRHGALRRARRGRAAPEPRAALRLRHVDDAQDACRPTLGVRALPRGARRGPRPRGLPGDAGRAAQPRHRRQGDVLRDRGLGRVPRLPAAGARATRTRTRPSSRRAASTC